MVDEFIRDVRENGITYDDFKDEVRNRMIETIDGISNIAIAGKLSEDTMRLALQAVFDECLYDESVIKM